MIRTPRFRRLAPVALLAAGALTLAACSSNSSSSSTTTASGSTSGSSGQAVTLSESGSSLLYPLFNLWVPGYQKVAPNVTIHTASTGSGTGISEALGGTIDIGASDAYLSNTQTAKTPDAMNIPLAISAQFIGYNVPGIPASTHLKLSGPVISKIYQGKITKWNDPAIAQLNSGVNLPSIPIVTLHRSDGSGDTFLFTQFLSKADPNGWGKTVQFGTTVQWPNAPGALAEKGNGGMVKGCQQTQGCIAYIGISYLKQASGVGEAQLQNKSGNFVLPNASTIVAEAKGYASSTPPSGSISMIYGDAAQGYPIINYEYAIVLSKQKDSTTASALRDFLNWAISPSGGNASTYLDQVGFQPLPASQVSQSKAQIAKIQS